MVLHGGRRTVNLDQKLLRQYEASQGGFRSPLNEDFFSRVMRPSKWILRVILMATSITVFSLSTLYYGTTSTRSEASRMTTDGRVFVEPIKECILGKCYTYTTRDEEYAAYFIPRKTKVNPYRIDYVISGNDICGGIGNLPYLVILVPSLPSHTDARKAIRNSWGSVSHGNPWPGRGAINETIKLVFLLGQSTGNKQKMKVELKRESEKYHDIVMGDFLDTYSNLSMKILMGLHWVASYCPDAKYILKADDDTFVNVPRLVEVLRPITFARHKGVAIGKIHDSPKVHRHGKWHVTMDMYPFQRYPKYLSGNTYVISANMAARLIRASEYMPYLPIEDAYITGILAKCVDAKHMEIPGFTFWFDSKPQVCDFKADKKISSTKASPETMQFIWNRLNSSSYNCIL